MQRVTMLPDAGFNIFDMWLTTPHENMVRAASKGENFRIERKDKIILKSATIENNVVCIFSDISNFPRPVY